MVTESVISFDCFLMNMDETDVESSFRVVYKRLLAYIALPGILVLGAFIFWMGIALVKGNYTERFSMFISTSIILLFLVHNDIVSIKPLLSCKF